MTTDITELAQREKFEAWFKSSFHPDKTGPYIKDQLYFAWKAAGAELVEALEKAQRRISRLESRTVKLPAERFCPAEYAGSQLWSETEVWNKAITACADELRAAGIKVEAE